MKHPPTTPPIPAEYYRRHLARVRQLASEATTEAIREQLLDAAARYEHVAERVDAAMLPVGRRSGRRGERPGAGRKIEHGNAQSPDRAERDQTDQGRRQFKIVRLLAETASVFQYRVKSQLDGHERVVREAQLARL